MKTLTKEFGLLSVTVAAATGTINATSDEGWEQLGAAGASSRFFVNHKYYDLAGLAMDDKTLFFDGAAVQDASLPSASPATPGQLVSTIDIMSNKPIPNAVIADLVLYGNIPSNNSSVPLTFDQTIYMRSRIFNIDLDNQAGGYAIQLSDNQLGSLSPTASDRVYCTRVVSVSEIDGAYQVYPCRYLIRANAREEAEYQYLMRLKRSYELQQEPDRD